MEITNLVIPKIGDCLDRIHDLALWIRDNLRNDTPFHLLKFHPNYQLTEIPSTPTKTLEEAYEQARETGLNYVYIGNVPGHPYENTYCPNCHTLLIKRFSSEIVKWQLTKNLTCPECGKKIPIRGGVHRSLSYPYSLI